MAWRDERFEVQDLEAERRQLGDRTVLLRDPVMVRAFELIERLAASEIPVLIAGETGVGKENAAYAVHHYSRRRGKPFVTLNCAALPEGLVESLVFGHERGMFTGAVTSRAGLFELADSGTLFLDEIGELPLPAQAKLLRVLEAKRVARLGQAHEREVDVRVVAATNRCLADEVRAGTFRSDLYFRLGSARVTLPALRERCPSEIRVLFHEFVKLAAGRLYRACPDVSTAAIDQLVAYAWPGNIRELRNAAEYAVATCANRIEITDLPELGAIGRVQTSGPMRRLADEISDLERRRMNEALARSNHVKVRAAELIGMPIRTFKAKAKQYGL